MSTKQGNPKVDDKEGFTTVTKKVTKRRLEIIAYKEELKRKELEKEERTKQMDTIKKGVLIDHTPTGVYTYYCPTQGIGKSARYRPFPVHVLPFETFTGTVPDFLLDDIRMDKQAGHYWIRRSQGLPSAGYTIVGERHCVPNAIVKQEVTKVAPVEQKAVEVMAPKDIECHWGPGCKLLAAGKCRFKHSILPMIDVENRVTKGVSDWHSACLNNSIYITPGRDKVRDQVIETLGRGSFVEQETWEPFVPRKHNVDGEIIRPFNARIALSRLVALCQKKVHGRNVRILDVYGSMKTSNLIAKINVAVPKQQRVTFTVHRPVIVPKDQLRMSIHDIGDEIINPNPIDQEPILIVNTPDEELTPYLSNRYFDGILIQDCQHTVATRDSLLSMVRRGLHVAVIFHVEVGPFGKSGVTGFFIRLGKQVINYAHTDPLVEPYVDNDDYSWILDNKYLDMSWSYEITYGNVGVAWFFHAPNTIVDFQPKWISEIGIERLAYNNRVKTVFQRTVDLLTGTYEFMVPFKQLFAGDEISLFVHYQIARTYALGVVDKTLEKSSQRAHLAAVTDAISKLPYAKFMMEQYPTQYQQLITGTVAYSAQCVTEIQSVVTNIQRADAARIASNFDNFSNTRSMFSVLPSVWRARDVAALVGLTFGSLAVIGCRYPSVGKQLASAIGVSLKLTKVPFQMANKFPVTTSLTLGTVIIYYRDKIMKWVDRHSVQSLISYKWWVDVFKHIEIKGVYAKPLDSHYIDTVFKEEELIDGITYDHIRPSKPHVWNRYSGLNFTIDYNKPPITALLMGPFDDNINYIAKSAINMKHLFVDVVARGYTNHKAQAEFVECFFDEPNLVRGYDTIKTLTFDERLEWARSKDKRKIYMHAVTVIDERSEGYYGDHVRIEVMAKTTEPMLKPKVRNIAIPGKEFTVTTGPYLDIITQRMKECWQQDLQYYGLTSVKNFAHLLGCDEISIKFRPIYGGAVKPAELSELLYELLLNNSPGCYTAIVSGDDGGLSFTKNFKTDNSIVSTTLVIETDASTFDRTEGHGLLRVEMAYIMKLGGSEKLIQQLMNMLGGKTVIRNPDDKSEYVTIDCSDAPRRRSGGTDTSLGNSIVMMELLKMLAYFVEARYELNRNYEEYIGPNFVSDITEFFKTMGIKIKAKVHTNPLRFSFLKGFLLPRTSGGYLWAPSPAKLVRMGTLLDDPNIMPQYQHLTYGLLTAEYRRSAYIADVLKGYKNYGNIPLIRALREAYRGYGTGLDINVTFQSLELDEYVDDLDWSYVFEHYDVTASEVEECEELLKWHKPGIFINHYVLERFAVDYR